MVDGDGVGGETIKVRVSIVGVGAQGLMRENVSEVLGEIKLTNHGGGRDRESWAVFLIRDVLAITEEVWGNHWNERVKMKR